MAQKRTDEERLLDVLGIWHGEIEERFENLKFDTTHIMARLLEFFSTFEYKFTENENIGTFESVKLNSLKRDPMVLVKYKDYPNWSDFSDVPMRLKMKAINEVFSFLNGGTTTG